jgi:hypothetical protein
MTSMSRRIIVCAGLVVCMLAVAACGGKRATSSGAQSTAAGGSAPAPAGSTASVRAPAADWPEFGDNAQATGVGPSRTGITPATVGRLRLRTMHIDGVADSAAIELHGVLVHGSRHDLVVVTTSYGKTVAIDARTGRRLWEFDPPGVNSTPGNPQVTNASPAADPNRRFVYSASPNGIIHKLSVATGHQVWSRRILFDPVHEKIASSLTISGPWLVAVTGGYYGDAPPYDGHVVTIDRTSGRIDHVWNSECSDRHQLIVASSCPATRYRGDNAIWGRAGAVIEPGSGRILVATGNGPFDGRTSWGDSVLELSAGAGQLLHNWTPARHPGRQGRPAPSAQPPSPQRHDRGPLAAAGRAAQPGLRAGRRPGGAPAGGVDTRREHLRVRGDEQRHRRLPAGGSRSSPPGAGLERRHSGHERGACRWPALRV